MKAYKVYDREGYSPYSVIVFAETRGKAIVEALGTDEFPSCDWEFTELKAIRVPSADKHYRGVGQMDWCNDNDRLILIKELNYRCDDDSFDPFDCKTCSEKDYCEKYGEWLDEQTAD